MTQTRILPRLIVSDPDRASAFYREVLGAEEVFRAPGDDGRPTVVELRLGGWSFRVSPVVAAWGWVSPRDLGGSPVLLEIEVDNPDEVGERMTAHGAEVVVAIENRPYGKRSGRIRDPFDHLWIVTGEPALDDIHAN
ncbi:VOC family protein [Embleya sp. NPDC059237]|uniref:VOC family protein n=1 Tax=Embleya sp. NPDC059237 TaxID=3346784 RepID=UPI00368D2557